MSITPTTDDRPSPPKADEPTPAPNVWQLPDGKVPWITLAVILVSASLTALYFTARASIDSVFYAQAVDIWTQGKWFGIIGSTLLHGGLFHLLFNLYWLWLFGRLLEPQLGALRYGGFILASAWISSIAQLAWAGNLGIGLSGVVYSLFGFLWISRSHAPEFSSVIPQKIILLFFGWLFVCIALTYAEIYSVANAAHFAGLVTGVVLGVAWIPGARREIAQAGAVALVSISFVPLYWAPWLDYWCGTRAYNAMTAKDHDTALYWFAKIDSPPELAEWARSGETGIRIYRRETAKSLSTLHEIARNSQDPGVLNTVAWRLATNPASELRDGARAVVYAKQACEIDGWKNAAYIDTLAAAHAETGDFSAAEMWMRRALENPGEHAAALKLHLDAFLARQPWRESPPSQHTTPQKAESTGNKKPPAGKAEGAER